MQSQKNFPGRAAFPPATQLGFFDQMNDPFNRPFRSGHGFQEKLVPIFDIHHAIHRADEERFYVHCSSNANPFTPPGAIRPHINILTSDHLVVSALVDSGAQICMGRSSLLTRTSCLSRVGSPIPILDCNGNTKLTEGEFSLKFDIEQDSTFIRNATANLHLSEKCSSEVILGMDFLSAMGAVICARTGRVRFFPEDHVRVASVVKPILAGGLAASAAEKQTGDLKEDLGKAAFTVSTIKDVDIPVNDQRFVKVQIDTPEGLGFKAGAKVIVSSGMLPSPITVDGIFYVDNANRISLPMVNMSTGHIDLKKDRPVPGIVVESMAPFGGPTMLDKADLIAMAHQDQATRAATQAAEAEAKRLGVVLVKPVPLHPKDEYDLRAKLKDSYKTAVAALEASGLPIPGTTALPKDEPSKQVRDFLIGNFAFKDIDEQYVEMYRKLILKNHDIFSRHKLDIGHCSHYQHRIVPLPGQAPKFQKQFKIPACDEGMLGDFADTMTAANVLIPTIQNTFNSAVFTVKKPSGVGRRVVQDFRLTNRCSAEDKWTVSDVRQSLINAGKNKPHIFSKVDATGAYYHLGLAPESQPWTTFTLPFRSASYMWARCAQGLQGASASFSKLMAIVFKDVPCTLTYIDDLLCLCQTHEHMAGTLQAVFNECRRHNIKLDISKTILGVRSIEWIGFSLSAKGISPAKAKLAFIEQLKPPETVKQIKSHLGFFQFIASNIEKYGWISHPLSQLTSQNSDWVSVKKSGELPKAAMEAWLELRRIALSNPCLAFPDHSRPFQLFVDACVGSKEERGGICGVLCQTHGGRTRPVGFFSRKMRSSENSYNPYNSELLAILRSLAHFETIIKGADVTVFSDHKPLVLEDQRTSKTMSHLSMKIQEFEAKLRFVKGSDNTFADFVSRHAATEDGPAGGPGGQNGPNTDWQSSHISEWGLTKVKKPTKAKSRPQAAASAGMVWSHPAAGVEATAADNFFSGRVGSSQSFHASVSSVTQESWIKAQKEDGLCQAVMDYLRERKVSKSPRFLPILRLFAYKACIGDDGILYLLDGKKGQLHQRRLWVPRDMQPLVLADAHGSKSKGHFKSEVVVQTLLQSFWWPTMAMDVENFVKSCPECYIQDDRHAKRTRTRSNPFPIPSYRGQYLFCDLVGPLKSETANSWILDMTDAYTRYVTLVPLPDKKAFTVANAIFEKYVMVFGPPTNVHTDNGKEFSNLVCNELYKLIEARSHTGCAYHPQAQGIVERNHRTINEYLRIFVDQSTTNWEEFLPPLQYALNTRTHSATKMSPYWMTFGQHPINPWTSPNSESRTYSESDIANKFRLLLFAHDIVNKNNLKAKVVAKRQYDKLSRERNFRVGDQVLVHYGDNPPGINKKFWTPWRGIFQIDHVLGHDTYSIRKPTGRRTKVHAKRIKFYDPLNSHEDPEVTLSKEDDTDVAHMEDVLEAAQDKEAAQAPRPDQHVSSSLGFQRQPHHAWQAQAAAALPNPAQPTFLQLARMHMQRQEAETHAPPRSVNLQSTRHPSVAIPMSHQHWLWEKEPPRNAFPSDV